MLATAAVAALALAADAGAVQATAEVPPAAAPLDPAATPAGTPLPTPWRVELKHVMSERGSAEESTRTTVRVEKVLDGFVTLLRLDVPYVDKNNAFASDPTNAGPGDLKARVGFRSLDSGAMRFWPYLDVVFPTANPPRLGKGKYQLGPGVTLFTPLPAPWGARGPALRFAPLVQQYLSVAGDPDRADVNYTQLEAELVATWPSRWEVALNPKPVIDWTHGAATAAVLDLKGAWIPSPAWRLWIKPGVRLWGPSLPATYDRQLELGVRFTY
jgi:hypothetical protein